MAGARQHRGLGNGQFCPDFQVYAASHTLGISERCSGPLSHQYQGWSTGVPTQRALSPGSPAPLLFPSIGA